MILYLDYIFYLNQEKKCRILQGKSKKMQKLNPYYVFNAGLLIVIGVYSFNLSNLYSNFSLRMIIFFISIIFLFYILGIEFEKQIKYISNDYEEIWKNKKYLLGTIISVLGTLLEGLYSHGYPLLGHYGNDINYGIPTFHVILTVYISFLTICIFESLLYRSKAKNKLILAIIINLFCLLLALSRLVMVIIFLNFMWLILFKKGKLKFSTRKFFTFIVTIVCFLYLFGILGNYRSNLQMNNSNDDLFDSTLIYNVGEAKNDVRDNKYLGPLFWDYIYISSPLANFQNIVNLKSNSENTDEKDIVTQYIPEIISNKFFPEYTWKLSMQYQVNPILNASTVFFSSYYILGWIGIIFMVLYMSIFPYVYMYLVKKLSPEYSEIAISFLNTIYLLNLFGNMFSNTVTSILLIFPFLASFCSKVKFNYKV